VQQAWSSPVKRLNVFSKCDQCVCVCVCVCVFSIPPADWCRSCHRKG